MHIVKFLYRSIVLGLFSHLVFITKEFVDSDTNWNGMQNIKNK